MRRLLVFLTAIALAAVAVAWVVARPDRPDPFYAGAIAEGPPGTLIRAEPFAGVPEGAVGWRLLHTAARPDGSTALASAIVVAPEGAGPFPVIGWAHGTTGVVPGCAPLIIDAPFANIPGYPDLLSRGWAMVAPDYPGLGTEGPHLYLVGADSGRAVLDALAAARALPDLALAPETVLWGHSQGGHSALWAAMLAPDHAPDLDLRGAAVAAPASDLPALLSAAAGTPFGGIVTAYLTAGYAAAYPELDLWSQIPLPARWIARDIASRCLEMPDALLSVVQSRLLPAAGLFGPEALARGLGARLEENIPAGPYRLPLMIAQGARDDLVLPDIQRRFAAALCTGGATLDWRLYEGRDHLSLVAPDSPLVPDLLDWTAERLAGAAAPENCPG